MSYVKTWTASHNLNSMELAKLEKDGLDILNDIPQYAKDGFESIPKERWDYFKWAGLYLQKPKEAGYFMMRVNVPSGLLNYEQLVTLAGIARDYGRDVFDITTRQAVQFHWLKIEDIPAIFDRLAAANMSSIGACGDIMRTILGNPLAGIDRDELLDTREITEGVYRHFLANSDFSNLPRKYKISINGSIYNPAHAEINCLAYLPATKVIDGEEVKGFHVKVGGGLSAKPFLAQELNVFVRPEQVKGVTIAITEIYRDYGYREKRHFSRLKFLVADWGAEKFTEKLLEVYGALPERGETAVKGWNAGYYYGAHPQKQDGLNYIGFNVPVGRLHTDEVLAIAEVAKQYGNGEVRTSSAQNLIIPNVPDANVQAVLDADVFKRVSVSPGTFVGYSVACTGSEYCNLALVETKNRMKHIAETLDQEFELDTPVRFHMVGCPNSCGQRQIADIGLQGVKMKTKDKGMVEAFEVYVGGTLVNNGDFNKKLKGKVDGDELIPVLKHLLTFFKEQKQQGENFYEFVNRVGVERLQTVFEEVVVTA